MKKLLAGIMAAGLILTFGCGKAAKSISEKAVEKAIEAQTGGKADVNITDGKVTVKTKDGTSSIDMSGGGAIPADFPKDVYVPGSAKIMGSVNTPDGTMVTMESSEALAKASEKYISEMKAQGWTEDANANMNGQIMLAFKKEQRTASVMLSSSDGKTQVILTVTKQAAKAE